MLAPNTLKCFYLREGSCRVYHLLQLRSIGVSCAALRLRARGVCSPTRAGLRPFSNMLPGDVRGKKFAVIGSGVSGLASAWLLSHHGACVTLFEKEETCGGHTLTDHSAGRPVDLGFQVYNLSTYPHLVAWLEMLGVATEASDMSFSLSVDNGHLEWASHGLSSVFAQRKNITSLSFLRMLWDVLRFGREAHAVLKPEHKEEFEAMSMQQYLARHGCASHAMCTQVIGNLALCSWQRQMGSIAVVPLLHTLRCAGLAAHTPMSVQVQRGLPGMLSVAHVRGCVVSSRHKGSGLSSADAGPLLGEPPPARHLAAPSLARCRRPQ